ncbi:MAG: 2-hydroxychromene-2-carboxylate isomerase [Dongiaceae bacterium]
MPTPATVEFYYSIGSRYSYLASTQIDRLERDTGCRVDWLPLSSVELMAAAGYRPFQGRASSGQYDWPYRRRDAAAWADYYGVPFREPADVESHPPNIACVAARRLDAAAQLSRRLFRCHFVEGRSNPGNAELVVLAAEVGLDGTRFEHYLTDPATEELHGTIVRQAKERGAFGVPTFVVGDQLFWGNDRLPLVRHALRKLGSGSV